MFAIYKSLQIVLQPEIWFLLCFIIACWLSRRADGARAAQRLAVVSALLLVVLSLPVTVRLMARPLERRATAPVSLTESRRDAIVVLGGSVKARPSPIDAIGGTSSLHRLIVGLGLWREGAAPKIVLVGGGEPIAPAEAMRAQALRLGVPAPAIIVEARSRTTAENAREVRRLIPTARRILLVSSAVHLPRAAMLFRQAGFEDVTLAPADELGPPALELGQLTPSGRSLASVGDVVHEYAGLAAAWLIR